MRASRVLPLFALLLLAGASKVAAQAGPEVPTAADQDGSAAAEAKVTAFVREALRAPDDRETWAGLAQSLSNIPIRGRQGLVGMRAAVHIADSLAFAPDLGAVGETVPKASGSWSRNLSDALTDFLEWMAPTGFPVDQRVLLPVSLSLVLAGWLLVRRGLLARAVTSGPLAFLGLVRRVSRVARGTTPQEAPRSGGKRDPRAVAISLVETGMPANEVARRTGMAQDEVSVLLAIQESRRAMGMPDGTSPGGRI
jgi:hypothetical protein